MAGKKQNDIRKTATNINSKWLQNTLRSMGVAGTEVIKDLMPATAETFSTASRAASEAARDIRSAKSGTNNVASAIKSNPAVRAGQEFFKNAITDIKSGNYNDRQPEMFDSDIFGDDDISFGDMEDDAASDTNVTNVIQDNGATLKAIQQQTEYQVRASKATVDSMVSIASASIMKTNEIGTKVLSELATINSNLAAMVEYNSTNMTKFIEASIGYYEQMSSSMNNSSSSSSSRVTQDKIYGSGGGLDFSSYKEYVKGNIAQWKDESVIGSMTSLILENKDAFITNPMNMIAKGVLKAAIPQVMKSSMQALDDSVKDFIPIMLERIGELGDNVTGPFSSVTQAISKIFGVKTKRQTEFDTTKIVKGPVPYNGIANHTIVEIIPKYLRESNTYLKEIAQAVTGKTESDMSKGFTGFDWETGKFKSIDDIRDSMYEQIMMEVTSSFERSDFGKYLAKKQDLLSSEKDRDNYSNALSEFFSAIERHNGMIDFKNQNHMTELLGSVNASDSIKNLIQASIEDMIESNSSLVGNAYRAKQTATRKKNNMMKYFEENASESGLYQVDGISYDNWYTSKHSSAATIGGTVGKSKVSASVPSLLQGIHDILNRGIYVQVKKNLGVTSIPSDYSTTASISESSSETIQSVDELRAALETDESSQATISINSKGGKIVKGASEKINSFTKILNGIMSGNADKAWDEFISGMGDMFKKAGGFVSEHFFNPIKKTLFGEKTEDGYMDSGLFAGVNNRMRESFYSLRHIITGKGYQTADGTVVQDANEDEMKNTVAGKLKGMLNYLKEGISLKIFGQKDDDGNTVEGKEGVVGRVKNNLFSITDSFHKGLNGWKEALFGKSDNPEEDQKKTWEDLKARASEVLPNAITGSVTGGILGTLVGGPIGGALVGFAGGILSKSKKFNNWLFGEEVDGERTGGIISKNVQDYMKKNGKLMAGAGIVGTATGAITGGGILGTLVGGPIGGAIMGIGTTMLAKSNMFQKFLFGDEDEGQKGLVNIVKGWFKKPDGSGGETVSDGKLLGMMGVGAGVGALGLALSPIGPIGGAIVGLGASILANKDNFHEWLFGKTDENGVKKEGILGQFKNMLGANVFGPLKDKVLDISSDFKTFLEYDILKKFNLVIEPIGNAIFGGLSKLTGKAMTSLSEFGNYIKTDFLQGLVEKTKNIMTPLTSAVGNVAEGIYKVGKHIISAPLNVLYAITSPIAQAVGKVVLGVTGAVSKTISNIIVKPIQALVLKPLGGLIKGVGKVISAPFVALGKVAEFVNDKIVSGINHVTRFVGTVFTDIKDAIGTKLVQPAGEWLKEHVGKQLVNAKNAIVDKVTKPFKIVGGFIKDSFKTVTDLIKEKVNGLFKGALGIITAPFRLLGKGLGSLFGIGKDNQGKGLGGYLRRTWNETGKGGFHKREGDDQSTTRQNWKNARRAAYERNSIEKQRRKDERWNQKQIAKYTKNQKMLDTEENRKLAEVMSGGKVRFKGEASDTEQKRVQVKIQEKHVEAAENTEKHTKDIKEILSDIKNFIFKYNPHWSSKDENNQYRGIASFLSGDSDSSVIPAKYTGSNSAPRGPVIVGENGIEAVYKKNSKFGKLVGIGGPEVINMEGGETIIPNNRLPKFEDGTKDDGNFNHSKLSDDRLQDVHDDTKLTIGERIIKSISGIKIGMFGTGTKPASKLKEGFAKLKNKLTGSSDSEDATAPSSAQASVSGLTGEKLRALRAAEREEDSDDATQEGILSHLKSLVIGQKEHSTVWNSIFSKKGLITGALLALIPLAMKLFNTDFGELLSGWFSNLGSHLRQGLASLGDGKTPIEKIQDEVNDVKNIGASLAKGDILGAANEFVYDENGNINHQSGSRAKFLAKGLPKAAATATGLFQKGKAFGTFVKSGFTDDAAKKILTTKTSKVGSNTMLEWSGKQLASSAAKSSIDDISESVAKNTGRFAGATVDDVAKSVSTVAKSSVDDISESVAKNVGKFAGATVDDVAKSVSTGMLDNVIRAVKSFFSGVIEKVSKSVGKKLSKVGTGLIDDVIKCLKKHFGKISAKIASILGISAGVAATGVGAIGLLAKEGTWIVLGAINGASGAKRLFRTDRSDALMIAISTALGAFSGSTIGSICDIVNELIVSVIGLDMYTELATLIYSFLAGEEKANMLMADQEAFYDSYDADRTSALTEQYATMQQAGLIDSNITLDQFIKGANTGDYGAKIQSFADYNDEKHKTLGAKIGDGFSAAGKSISKGAKSAWGAIAGKTDTYYEDTRGNQYRKNDDGTYQVTDKSGNDLGYIGAGALPADAKEVTKKTDGFVQKAGAAIKSGFENTKDAVVNAYNIAKEKIGAFISPITEGVGNAIEFLKTNAIDSVKAIGGGFKKIEENFNNNDMDLKAYLTADVNDSDENNPLHGLIDGMLNASKILMFPKLVFTGIMNKVGTKVKDTVKKLADGAKRVVSAYKTENNKLNSYSSAGNFEALNSYTASVPDGTPISGVVNGILTASKFIHYIPTTVHFIGNSISNGIKVVAEKTKAVINAVSGENEKLKNIANNGDLSALNSYTPSFDESTPLSGVLSAVMNGYKFVMYPSTILHSVGNKIKETVTTIASTIGTTVSAVGPSTKSMFNLAKSGDVTGLQNYNANIPEDSPLSGVINGIIGIEKTVFSPIASVASFGKSVKETVGAGLDKFADLGSSIKSYISTLNSYTDPDKSMSGFASETMEGSDDDPAKAVIAPIINKVMSTYVRIVRAINEFGDGIKNTINGVTDGAVELWNDVTTGAAELGNNIKDGWNSGVAAAGNVINNAGTWAMNLARGGWGKGVQGGRGEEPQILNGSIYYSQNDSRWANSKFVQSNGVDDGATMADTGCGPTAMSMVISNMKNKPSSPVDLAKYAQSSGDRDETGTNWNFVDKASRQYGLISNKITAPSSTHILESVATGNPVLLSGQDDGTGLSPYTTAGHYVVAVGLDTNGNVIINDPRGSSYSRAMSPADLASTTSAAWTFSHTKPSSGGGRGVLNAMKRFIRGGRGIDRTSWIAIIQAVKKAIAAQAPGYSQTNWINITIGGKTLKVRTDCSGLVSACLKYYGSITDGANYSSRMLNKKDDQTLLAAGFTPKSWPGWEGLQAGDILAKDGHTEIYAGKDGNKYYVYNCGSDSSVNNPNPTGKSYDAYTTVWEPGSPGPSCITNLTVSDTGLNASASSASTSGSSLLSGIGSATGSLFGGDVFSKITSAFSSIGTTLSNALFTGNFGIDWKSALSGSSSGGTTALTSGGSASGVTAADISGSDNAQKTWNYLVGKGMPKYGVAGLMGNLHAESGIRPDNVQNSYEAKVGSDTEYTNAINNGSYSEDKFSNDAAGYGLAQWTSTGRKRGLYQFAKSSNRRIDDLGLQLDWLWQELNSSYPKVFNTLMSASNVKTGSDSVLHDFERPADQSASMENKRASFGMGYYEKYAGGGSGTGSKPSFGAQVSPRRYVGPQMVRGGHGDIIPVRSTVPTKSVGTTSNIANLTNNTINMTTGNVEALLTQAIKILTVISNNSNNLELLKDIKSGVGKSSNFVSTTNNISSGNGIEHKTASGIISSNEQTARKIAFGQ